MHVSGCPCNWSGGQYAKCECEHWRQIHAMNENTAAIEAHRRTMEEDANKDARIADLESRLAAMTKYRDAQAEAVRVLAEYVRLGEVAWDNGLLMWDVGEQQGSFQGLPRQWENAEKAVFANPIAAAAVKEGVE